MGITVKALTVAQYDIPYAGFVSPVPETAIARRRSSKPYPCPSIAYVIDHPDGRMLWETSVATTIFQDWPQDVQEIVDLNGVDTAGLLEARLRAVGLGPEDFDYVVMGHLHCDHAGGLRLFESTDAKIVVHERELAHVLSLEEDGTSTCESTGGFSPIERSPRSRTETRFSATSGSTTSPDTPRD